jgi:GTPase SAR1 family protein
MIEWVVISAAVTPHIKKYVTEKAAKLAKESTNSTLAKIYRRHVPSEKLVKATEAFVIRFSKELDSAADLPTLTLPAYRDALKTFLCDPDVLEALETPLDSQSELNRELLSSRWRYLRMSDGNPLIDLPSDFDWARLGKRYLEALQKQALGDPELRQIMQARSSLRIANAVEETAAGVSRIAGPFKVFDLLGYSQSIKEAYSFLRLGSLDADWAAYENRVHLENVYVPQSAKQALPPRDLTRDYLRRLQTRGADISAEDLENSKKSYEGIVAIPILDVVDTKAYDRLVILGDPGLGKSTLLRYLTLRWAQDQARPLALLLELRRTVDEPERIDFLKCFEHGPMPTMPLPRQALHRYLKEHDSLLLFDGLDEVIETWRGDIVSLIISFSREYPKARIVVTTRIHGYYPGSSHPEQFRDAHFEQFTLQDFNDLEINRFTGLWHKEAFANPQEGTRYEERLRKAISDSPAVRELAGNPLLLTLMTILNRVQDLPKDRNKLYERCAELLLKNWDLEKFPELLGKRDTRDIKDKLGPDQKMRILEHVAVAMQKERTGLAGNMIHEDTLKEIVQEELNVLGVPQAWAVAEDLIWMLRERNFMLAYLGDHQYAFMHRTFLEFFCARDLKYRLEKTSNFKIEQLLVVVRERWRQDEWREVLSLLCGMIGSEYAAMCVSEILSREGEEDGDEAVIMGAKCLEEIRELRNVSELRKHTYEALVRISQSDLPKEGTDKIAQRAKQHEAAISFLARGWKEDPCTLPWLKQQVAYCPSTSVRAAALFEIARGWREDPDGVLLARKCAVEDPSSQVRVSAVKLLAGRWKDQSALPLVKQILTNDDDEIVRLFVMVLAWTEWGHLAEEMQWLTERVTKDDSVTLRSLYVAVVGGLFDGPVVAQNPRTPEWLQEFAVRDPNGRVRSLAIDALRKGWGTSPEIKAFVEERDRLEALNGPTKDKGTENL